MLSLFFDYFRKILRYLFRRDMAKVFMALVRRWVRKLIIGWIWCIKHTMSKIHNYASFSLQMIHFSLLWNKWFEIKNSRRILTKKMNNSWEKSFARARLFAEKMCSNSVKPFLLLNIVISGLILVATWVWFIFWWKF